MGSVNMLGALGHSPKRCNTAPPLLGSHLMDCRDPQRRKGSDRLLLETQTGEQNPQRKGRG